MILANRISIVFVFVFLTLFACTDSPDIIDPCLENPVSIRVALVDSVNNRIKFNSSQTFIQGEDKPILMFDLLENPSGVVVITDKEIEKLPNDTNVLLVKVFKNLDTILQQTFIIGNDRCHVSKIQGPDTIVIR